MQSNETKIINLQQKKRIKTKPIKFTLFESLSVNVTTKIFFKKKGSKMKQINIVVKISVNIDCDK